MKQPVYFHLLSVYDYPPSVSYTHLDVYKRQVGSRLTQQICVNVNGLDDACQNKQELDAVSYTHLDVYKRQVLTGMVAYRIRRRNYK